MKLGEVKEHPQAHTATRGGQILHSGDHGNLNTLERHSFLLHSYLTHQAPLTWEDSMLISPTAPQACNSGPKALGADVIISFLSLFPGCQIF